MPSFRRLRRYDYFSTEKVELTIKKIKELDILSGIAIIMVVLIHADRFYVRTVLNLDSYLGSTPKLVLDT